MGQARDVMDRLTTAITTKDAETLKACYAAGAATQTPDQGTITGRDAVCNYFLEFFEAFPDVNYESVEKNEAGNVAFDEGFIAGTHTGPMRLPSGETVPATGKHIRVRSCDIATVESGEITSHRIYFDQMEFMAQLGLMRELSSH
jgi:predicted ester cyclase